MLLEFFNDAMTCASTIMNPIWNNNPNKAYALSNIACQLIDRCRVYSVAIAQHEECERIKQKLADIRLTSLIQNADVLAFVQKWEITIWSSHDIIL